MQRQHPLGPKVILRDRCGLLIVSSVCPLAEGGQADYSCRQVRQTEWKRLGRSRDLTHARVPQANRQMLGWRLS
jgi:hypothetical protein